MKTVKVNHVVLTINIAPGGNGESRDEVDKKINARLAEGYDEVEVIPLRTNFDENRQVTDIVNQYIFRKYAEDEVKAAKK